VNDAIRAVFAVLSTHIPRGQIAKIQEILPKGLRAFWMAAEEGVVPPPERGEVRRPRIDRAETRYQAE
jgi:hypothetical protein